MCKSKTNYRERTCNFCDFAKKQWLPEGVVCSEEHHQEGKDRFQYYEHEGCDYFKDDNHNDIYGLEKYRRESHRKEIIGRREYLREEIRNMREKLAGLEKELSELKDED